MRLAGAILLASIALLAACAPPPRDLLVLSLDTVRRDHLSVYGYQRPTTPRLEDLAREAAVFDQAFAPDTNTAPSHATLFTGLYPHRHGATANGRPLPPGPATLAEILAGAGYRTGAFVSGYTLESEVSGLDRGFEVYDDAFEGLRRDGAQTVDRALAWLGEDDGRPFFLFLHLFDAHGPYLPAPEYLELFHRREPGPRLPRIARHHRLTTPDGRVIDRLNRYVDRYDALIRYQDDLAAKVLARIDPRRTVVLVLADHGETLGERYHAIDHGGQVFDEQIRVPLLLVAPGLAPGRSDRLVESTDLLPTLLELLGLAPPAGIELPGRSLLAPDDPAADRRRLVFSSARAAKARYADRSYRLDERRRILSARGRRWKLIVYPGVEGDYVELYDLREDPGETVDRAAERPKIRDELLRRLRAWHEGAAAAPPLEEELPPETLERLRALGYIGD